MRNRSVKVERYRMWFSDLKGTATLFKEKSCEGWHVSEFDVESGKFTYKKQEPKNYFYIFAVNGQSDDFSIYDEESGFEKIAENAGLSLFRREEEGEENAEAAKMSFTTVEEEEKWLSQQAAEGSFLLRSQRPDYIFSMGEKTDCRFKVDYAPDVDNPQEYLAKFKAAGWEYVCGNDGYHYFAADVQKKTDESVFNSEKTNEQVSQSRKNQYISFMAMSLFGAGLSIFKLFFDYKKYAPGENNDGTAKSLIMDIAALAICGIIAVYGLVRYIIEKRRGA